MAIHKMTGVIHVSIVANISLEHLTAHPIFCLHLAHNLAKDRTVVLYIPESENSIDLRRLGDELGFPINFEVKFILHHFVGRKSLMLFYALAVMRLLRNRKTLLWAFEPYSVRFASFFGIRSVMEIHASLPTQRYLKVAKQIQDRTSFKLFITNSQAHSQLLAVHGLLPDRLYGAHNAISESLFGVKAVLPSKAQFWHQYKVKEELIITYAGSLYRGRGIDFIVRVAPAFPQCAFVILGGPDVEREKLEILKESTNIYFLGKVPPEKVFFYLALSDILVALYNQDCEDIGGNKTIQTASPMKLFEYMASGVPIISSNIGAIPEIIESGKEGVLIDPDNLGEFVSAIRTLMENRPFADQIKGEALSKVRRYTWPARLESIFSRIV